MNIIVISDTHGNPSLIRKVLENEPCDHLIFLGDGLSDLHDLPHLYPSLVISSVRGNCDIGHAQILNELLLELNGHRLLLTHGHRYHVKSTMDEILRHGHEMNAEAVLFGHTHQSCLEYKEDLWLVNPGSLGSPNSFYPVRSYAAIRCEENQPLQISIRQL